LKTTVRVKVEVYIIVLLDIGNLSLCLFPQTFWLFLLANRLTMSVPDEAYSRNASWALSL